MAEKAVSLVMLLGALQPIVEVVSGFLVLLPKDLFPWQPQKFWRNAIMALRIVWHA